MKSLSMAIFQIKDFVDVHKCIVTPSVEELEKNQLARKYDESVFLVWIRVDFGSGGFS